MAIKITKKPRKQKIKAQKHFSIQLPTSQIKISEAILRLCEPLLIRYREPHRSEVIVMIAVMAWNISLFPKEDQAKAQELLIDTLPEKFSAEDVSVFLENIDTLIERKDRDYH